MNTHTEEKHPKLSEKQHYKPRSANESISNVKNTYFKHWKIYEPALDDRRHTIQFVILRVSVTIQWRKTKKEEKKKKIVTEKKSKMNNS